MSKQINNVAVVSGAGSGIGAALARQCADQGMFVYGVDIDQGGLDALAEYASANALKIDTSILDVRDDKAYAAFAERVFAEQGEVNLLFNNAGVLIDGRCWERKIEDWKWNFDVNVIGVVNAITSFTPKMLTQKTAGTIVNTASIGGLLGGGSFLAPYQGTKHAVVAITESLYSELAQEDAPITAACLCPGDTATGIWEPDRLRPEAEHNQFQSDDEQQMHDFVADMCANGFTADQAAAATLAAVDAGKFWIFPQPEFKPLFEMRIEAILSESLPRTTEEMMSAMTDA